VNLSIIIVNWNTRDFLVGCLSSIYTDSPPDPFEVLVIDNASTDGSAQLVREHFPKVRLIENRENSGFARANNRAIKQSSGRYLLLLNSDTEVQPGALETLVDYMEENPQVGVAGSQLLNPDGSLQISCFPAPTLLRELWRLFHLDKVIPFGTYTMKTWELDRARPVDVLMGACMILRRETLRQVGLFDEDYFMYSEETDLCNRIQRAGWGLSWVPQAKVMHYGGQSTRLVSADMFMNLYHSKIMYFRKNHSRLAGYVYKLILLAAALGRLVIAPVAFLEKPPQRQAHLTLAQHYRRLVLALPRM
jgi:GT2 family glycosyltransferase